MISPSFLIKMNTKVNISKLLYNYSSLTDFFFTNERLYLTLDSSVNIVISLLVRRSEFESW